MSHTIAAVSTGNQVSAIGIIRMTGDDCIAVAEKVFTLYKGTLSAAPERIALPGFAARMHEIGVFLSIVTDFEKRYMPSAKTISFDLSEDFFEATTALAKVA